LRAAVSRFHSPDVDLDSFSPADPGDVAVLVQAMVAPQGTPGEESFDVLVCTPAWLARAAATEGPVDGRHHLIIGAWDLALVRATLTERLTSPEADSWPELAQVLGRIGKWEFEDYRP
jgi:hypothetical protein